MGMLYMNPKIEEIKYTLYETHNQERLQKFHQLKQVFVEEED